MTRLRVFAVRVAGMFGLDRREDGLSEEMQLHLELLADEHRRRGLSDEDAKAAARRSFGAVLPVREAYRAQLRFPSVDALVQDVRFAARRLLRDRNATLAAIALLSLGVASTVIMGDILDRLLVRPPAGVGAPDRVVRLYDQSASGRPSALVTNYVTVEHLRAGLRNEVESMAAYKTEQIGLGRGTDARRIHAVMHTDAYFDVLGLAPALGALPRGGQPEPGGRAARDTTRSGSSHDCELTWIVHVPKCTRQPSTTRGHCPNGPRRGSLPTTSCSASCRLPACPAELDRFERSSGSAPCQGWCS